MHKQKDDLIYITIGKAYDVCGCDGQYILITNDVGKTTYYNIKRFDDLISHREQKISILLS